MRVALLARVSTEEQAGEDRHSLPAQLRAMRSRCEREGWEIVREYVALGESAFVEELAKRPVLAEAVRAAEAGEFDLLMVHESSRFARKAKLHHEVESRLERAGVRLLGAESPLVERSPETFVASGVEAVLNEYWSRKMSQHISKGQRERFERGLHVGPLAFGYAVQWKELADGSRVRATELPAVVVQEEAVHVVRAFRDRVAGAGYTELAERWNGLGLRPRSNRGNTWFTDSAVQSVLENDFYAGFIRYRGERRRGLHEAIITEDEWLAAQAVVRRQRAPRSMNERVLSGMAECMDCGTPMWLWRSGNAKYRRDYYREGDRPGRCGSKGWAADQVDGLLDQVFVSMSTDVGWLSGLERRARTTSPVDAGAARERERLQEEKRRATNAYLAGALEEAEWKERLAAIEGRLRVLPNGLAGGVLFGSKRFESLAGVWVGMTVEEKREVMRTVFERVHVDVGRRELGFAVREEFVGLFEDRRRWVLVGLVPRVGLEPTTF